MMTQEAMIDTQHQDPTNIRDNNLEDLQNQAQGHGVNHTTLDHCLNLITVLNTRANRHTQTPQHSMPGPLVVNLKMVQDTLLDVQCQNPINIKDKNLVDIQNQIWSHGVSQITLDHLNLITVPNMTVNHHTQIRGQNHQSMKLDLITATTKLVSLTIQTVPMNDTSIQDDLLGVNI